jgi:site-specific DNA-adenine methylase
VDELTIKHVDLQAFYMEIKGSNEKLIESYAMLEVSHKVMISMIKSYQLTNDTCSQNKNKAKQFWFEQVIMEDCNDDLIQENEVLQQEVERLSKELTKMKGKIVIQPSQDNRETMVKKLQKRSTVQSSCNQVHKSNKNESLRQRKRIWIISSVSSAPTWNIMLQYAQSS